MLEKHPIMEEETSYKVKYINVLEYFARKYSKDDAWANATLRLYIKTLLKDGSVYQYDNHINIQQQSKRVVATKFKPFQFFTYRYCLLFDCIFINAYNDQLKGEKIFKEISTIYHKRYQKKLLQVFRFLYDANVSLDGVERVQYMEECWNRNRAFLETKPIKVMVTANMSAGKSTLINALVGKKVNKTQNDTCTAKIHYIVNKAFEDNFCYKMDHLLELDTHYDGLMEDRKENKTNNITVGVHFQTVNAPTKRLWLIDTPGVNSSQDQFHKDITEQAIKSVQTDLLIYLLNGENIGTDDDRRHLAFILENYDGKILFVINKVDRFKKKEDSVIETLETVRADLRKMGFSSPLVIPISAYAAYLAKRSILGEVLDEDEQDEHNRMWRKLKKEEYQFDSYYPEEIQKAVQIKNNAQEYELMMHSGLLQLEYIIYNMR